ncbi:hypothetical protein [Campylobacter gastrosuis]|uniref:Periplasmic protein n=1 Tax=Campylobacter gastrosuis TaxID=2974576 RepID=A0ABT7HN46_9BACT|nr:hypothetical protein [Campylobacter gastrosuis]MDL0088347.1 hypothetical protein [Campylobacter gastrosuis]
MKKLILIAFFCVFALSDALKISDFNADIFSKSGQNQTKKIAINLELIGTDLAENEAYVLDALNVIVGSFYAEDLLTSLGKEKFKDAFKKYTLKKHSVEIDNVLILGLKVVDDLDIERIIEAIKTKNLCQTTAQNETQNSQKKQNKIIVSPKLDAINQSPIDLNSIADFGKDFGE